MSPPKAPIRMAVCMENTCSAASMQASITKGTILNRFHLGRTAVSRNRAATKEKTRAACFFSAISALLPQDDEHLLQVLEIHVAGDAGVVFAVVLVGQEDDLTHIQPLREDAA